ncbi:TadE/TadG family type IV pilus assembly protein [Sagittula sp. S175]|uniref:TadE/TadG family type IV pilus assembly protein n=1 Tax=Sagittula sp. S175 TaxID=3415129 RepID=UPI003C7A6B1E
MTRFLLPRLRHHVASEDGTMAPSVALWMPVFLLLIVSSIELGTLTARHTMLEKALDQTMREVKIGIGPTNHQQMKESICEKARILPDCTENLRLEMIPMDMNAWVEPPAMVDCTDAAQPLTPQRQFTMGGGGQMMFLRACFKFRPATAISGFNASLGKDSSGYAALVSTTAFVNEPS